MSQMEHVHPQMLKQLKERAARCTELEKAAAEVVAELRRRADAILSDNTTEDDEVIEETWTAEEDALRAAADLVVEKLGVK